MSAQFLFDVETLDNKQSAVILSAALLVVDFSKQFTHSDLLANSLFVKFDAKSQVPRRTVTQKTLDWWMKQDPVVRKLAMEPSPQDVSLEDGFDTLCNFFKKHIMDKWTTVVWTRGLLDGAVLEDIADQLGKAVPFSHNRVRDVRTAIDMLSGSNTGFCETDPPLPPIRKHYPVDDCVMDAWTLRYYKVVS